jgi:hypothetical protein
MGRKGIGRGGVNWIHPALGGYTWGDVIHRLMKLLNPLLSFLYYVQVIVFNDIILDRLKFCPFFNTRVQA